MWSLPFFVCDNQGVIIIPITDFLLPSWEATLFICKSDKPKLDGEVGWWKKPISSVGAPDQFLKKKEKKVNTKTGISLGGECALRVPFQFNVNKCQCSEDEFASFALPQLHGAVTLTDNKQLHHRGCGKPMHHERNCHPSLLHLLYILLSSALHTFCYSMAHVNPVICICRCSLLVFEGPLCLAWKTMKKHWQVVFRR